MATKKSAKTKKANSRRPKVKTPVGEAQTIAGLRRELEARDRDLAALCDVSSAASRSLEIKPVLDEVVKKISDIFTFNSVSVFLFDPKNGVLNLMAAAGVHEIQALPRAFRRGRGLTGRVAETGQHLIFEDVRSDPRYRQMTENNAMERMGDRFIAIFPITAKEKFLGTINCINKEARKLTTGEIRLINSMADQIGVAVDNINLFKEVETSNAELREALEHQTATSEVLGIISRSPTDVQPVLDAIVESASRVCGVDDITLRLCDGNSMAVRAHFGAVPVPGGEIGIDAPPVRWVREHGTLHVPDIRTQTEIPFVFPGTLRTFLIIPLRHKGEFIGGLTARRMEVRPFSQAQIKLLETFADQAVIAIENVRLFNELKESLEQQTATSEILGVIASSPTDIQPVLDVVAENAARLCDATDATIRRVDGDMLRAVANYGPLPMGDRELLPLDRD
jgi:GAF domain-containing protein